MTPKEKAKEIFTKYQNINLTEDSMGIDDELAKQCSLILVADCIRICSYLQVKFWLQVKEEIEAL